MRTLTILLVSMAALVGCKSPDVITPGGSSGRYLLEYEYTNHAWGYSHFGLVVDDSGRVYRYEYPRTATWWQAQEDGIYTRAELDAKYAPGRRYVRTIGRDTLAEIKTLLTRAHEGELGDRRSAGADMGQYDYIAYIDPYAMIDGGGRIYPEAYEYILLRTRGDFEQERNAAAPRRLAELLGAIAGE